MTPTKHYAKRSGFLLGLVASFALLLPASGATAASGVAWRVDPLASTTVAPDASAGVTTTTNGSVAPAVNEVQKLTIAAGGGQFRLTFGAQSTNDIAFDAPAATVQAELQALPSIGSGNVSVSGGPGESIGYFPYLISFGGALAAQDVEQIAVEDGTAPLHSVIDYRVQLTNVGDANADGSVKPISFTGTLPSGLTIESAFKAGASEFEWDCSGVLAGEQSFACTSNSVLPPWGRTTLAVEVAVDPSAAGVLTSQFAVSGGAASNPSASAVDTTTIAPSPLPFGIDAFDSELFADEAGAPSTQAASHPYSTTTSIDFNTLTNPVPLKGNAWPVEPARDVLVDLPPGLIGSTVGLPQCTLGQLSNMASLEVHALCPPESQVGTTIIRSFISSNPFPLNKGTTTATAPLPVYNMIPPPRAAARFAFNAAGAIVNLDVHVRNGSDYGLLVDVEGISEGLAVAGTKVTFWGVPADSSHTRERSCPGKNPPTTPGETPCTSEAPRKPLLRNPTACTPAGVGLPTTVRTDSWVDPGDFDTATSFSHLPPGYPFPSGEQQGPESCDGVHFRPMIEATPTTNVADSPSGLDFHLRVPQDCWEHPEEICQSDLKDAEVKLPAGMSLNPSAATGLGSCTTSQVGFKPGTSDPFEFSPNPAHCPDNAKIGTVSVATPALDHPIDGSVYLAAQGDNPFGSLLAMYLVAEDPASGVVLKQAGKIEIGADGRLTTVFTSAPQAPFSDLHLQLFGGPRAALRTPPSCGTYGISAKLTPWSGGAPVNAGASFEIESCLGGGFDPKLFAGTHNPLAGAFSPFSLRLTREDGSEELGGLSTTLPPGLAARFAGIPYCPDAVLSSVSGNEGTGAAQIANPSCPAASQIGSLTVGAGAGPNPFFTNAGRVYLAAPYKGAPLSIAVVAPAVAGPFDLGSVVVRNAVYVDPQSAQGRVISDPFPTSLHGVPLDLRDVRVNLDRPGFTLNPTSCDPMAIEARISSAAGKSAERQSRFQAAGCERLAFKPKLSLRLKGGTKRGGHPALTSTLSAPEGQANIEKVIVALPHSEFLDQAHIKTICTRVQFAANACPAGSIYGQAWAISPLVDYPLEGPVYLRSSNHNLPDLVLALKGPASQPIEIDVAGRIDSFKQGIRASFESVPDAPVSKFTLTMKGGSKGLLINSRDVCAKTYRASVQMEAHNAKTRDFKPPLNAACAKAKKQRRAR